MNSKSNSSTEPVHLEPAPILHPKPKRFRKAAKRTVFASSMLVLGLTGVGTWKFRSSLPALSGKHVTANVFESVKIDRDAMGIPTIHATSRTDAAYGLGFAHAQDRFFQMDLLRRVPSGRLAELVGKAAVGADKRYRKHRFSEMAEKVFAKADREHQLILEAYCRGVNEGLQKLDDEPFEYQVLQATPEPWKPTDSFLVMVTMLCDLQPMDGSPEQALTLLHEKVPQEVFDYLVRAGSRWDAALDDSKLTQPSIPGPEVWSLRGGKSNDQPETISQTPHQLDTTELAWLNASHLLDPEFRVGSNNWAVSSKLGKPAEGIGGSNRAILASDMHLGLRVPTVWYRAVMRTPTRNHPNRQLVGVTLPGAPVMVEGSNGSVAWGFTNSTGDFGDLIELKMIDDNQYATPQGPRALETFTEKIAYSGGAEDYTFEWSIWGPVVEVRDKRKFVHKWIGNDPEAFDLNILNMESARSVEELAGMANRAGMPNQNVMMVDDQGNIGWTISGRLPKRKGSPEWVARDWSTQEAWEGYYTPEEHPRVMNPPSGRLWTANNRIMGGEFLQSVGDGRFDPGARATQIRDRLFEKEQFEEKDLLAIQLDDEGRMLKVWQKWLLEVLDADPKATSQEFADYAKKQELRASTDSVVYRIVHEFRNQVFSRIFGFDIARRGNSDAKKRGLALRLGINRSIPVSYEDVAEELIEQKPMHWLPDEFETWESLLKDSVVATQSELTRDQPLAEATWGKRNRAAIKHPLSMAAPALGTLLDMPDVELPGDSHLPRVQSPSGGASQRLVVSPGFEQVGIYHQPGGASGHPLSPYYRAGFDDWAQGNASTLLPGPVVHSIQITPK
ncbi:MAG: penicillin acylase family protein [Planctomycetota bacterium]